MGRRYDLALMILGRRAPQLRQLECLANCGTRPRRRFVLLRHRENTILRRASEAARIATIATAGPMVDKIDPFDVKALGDAVNDSASRVSTIWVSFLIFSLYLLTTASTVTHRQLFLAEPVKLPVLNIDLPLWGFFFLAPILFVIFHLYVLLQVLLLSHSAAAYNSAVEGAAYSTEENASLRQRLANTLFAQIFAGAPRERSGWIGWMLKAMASITLMIAPILILVVFQFAFLPYHSHIATWTHRFLILAEITLAFTLWPLVLDARRDFEWRPIWIDCKRVVGLPLHLLAKGGLADEWAWLRQHAAPLSSFALFVLVSLILATFPGEPHLNLLTGRALSTVQCDRWLQQKFEFLDMRFERLDLAHVDVIDHEKLQKIEEVKEKARESARTQIVRDRNLNCGDFSNRTDLRYVDFTRSRLSHANFGAARLEGASLDFADLQNAFFGSAQLQGASLDYAALQGAFLGSTQLQGASLQSAHLEGATLNSAQLQGAQLFDADLRGASLAETELVGASLGSAQLQGASLPRVRLQGAQLRNAQFDGADLSSAQMQGADFSDASLDHADLTNASTWRTTPADCDAANVHNHNPAAVIDEGIYMIGGLQLRRIRIPAASTDIKSFIERATAGIQDSGQQKSISNQLHKVLDVDSTKGPTDDFAGTWDTCEQATHGRTREKFDAEHAALLRDLACDATQDREAIGAGIVRNWVIVPQNTRIFIPFGSRPAPPRIAAQLARGLLGLDGHTCPATNDFDTTILSQLRAAAQSPVRAPAK
jgi:uncharacterized protein YjbI with pentapeptide repeats